MQDIYLRLAKHLENLIMGYPFNEALTDLLKEMYNPVEAEVALAIPNNLQPLDVVNHQSIVDRCDLPESKVIEALQSLSDRNMVYTRTTGTGDMGYALLQVGYGVPQTFFWSGRKDERARRRRCRCASSRSGNKADALTPPRPFGLGSAGILALLLAPYIPQRVCASLAPSQRPWGPQQSVSVTS